MALPCSKGPQRVSGRLPSWSIGRLRYHDGWFDGWVLPSVFSAEWSVSNFDALCSTFLDFEERDSVFWPPD